MTIIALPNEQSDIAHTIWNSRTMSATLTIALLLASLLGSHAGRQDTENPVSQDFEPPKWYHGNDGPIFQVVQTLDDAELRRYEATKWVTTNITGATFDDAYKQATPKLDDYWKGNNHPGGQQPGEGGSKIDDTVPTFALMYPTGAGRAVQTTFTFEYFLPHELHATPPQPATAELNVLDVQPQDVWIKVFGGYAGEKEVMDQAFGFMEQLKAQGVDIDESFLGVAFYDAPTRILNRHNEIWIWAKQAPSAKVEAVARSWLQRLKDLLTGHA